LGGLEQQQNQAEGVEVLSQLDFDGKLINVSQNIIF
jgi:hypothetical protein